MKKCIALFFSMVAFPLGLNAYTVKFYLFGKGNKRIVMIGGLHGRSKTEEEERKLEKFHSGFFENINKNYKDRALVFTEAVRTPPDKLALFNEDPEKNPEAYVWLGSVNKFLSDPY